VITILVGGREYDSWDALPEEVRAQLLAAGVDPGPDGRLDSLDLSRAAGSLTRRTVVTGPGGAPLPPVVARVLASIADALRPAAPATTPLPAPESPPLAVPDDRVLESVGADAVDDAGDDAGDDVDASTGRSRRLPLLLGWIVIGATVLLVATVVVIGLSGI
jgi:hypothetical protein